MFNRMICAVALIAMVTVPNPGTAHAAGSYNQLVLSDGPVLFLGMNGTGTETDLTGNGLTGTYRGEQPPKVALPNGARAADFNGSSEYLTVRSDPRLSITRTGKLTWEGWIRPDVLNFLHTTGGTAYVDWMGRCQVYAPSCQWEARMYNKDTSRPSRLSAYVFNPSAGLGSAADWQSAGTSQIRAGRWYYVVGEYQTLTQPRRCDGPQVGSINIWVNGVKWDQAAHGQTGCMSQYGATPRAGDSPLNIGTMAFDSWFKGAVGKVAVYDKLLTPAQIAAHYQAMTGRPPSGTCRLRVKDTSTRPGGGVFCEQRVLTAGIGSGRCKPRLSGTRDAGLAAPVSAPPARWTCLPL